MFGSPEKRDTLVFPRHDQPRRSYRGETAPSYSDRQIYDYDAEPNRERRGRSRSQSRSRIAGSNSGRSTRGFPVSEGSRQEQPIESSSAKSQYDEDDGIRVTATTGLDSPVSMGSQNRGQLVPSMSAQDSYYSSGSRIDTLRERPSIQPSPIPTLDELERDAELDRFGVPTHKRDQVYQEQERGFQQYARNRDLHNANYDRRDSSRHRTQIYQEPGSEVYRSILRNPNSVPAGFQFHAHGSRFASDEEYSRRPERRSTRPFDIDYESDGEHLKTPMPRRASATNLADAFDGISVSDSRYSMRTNHSSEADILDRARSGMSRATSRSSMARQRNIQPVTSMNRLEEFRSKWLDPNRDPLSLGRENSSSSSSYNPSLRRSASRAHLRSRSNNDIPLVPAEIEVLLFNVVGTVVDWQSSVVLELKQLEDEYLEPGILAPVDWVSFAREWRKIYCELMEQECMRTGSERGVYRNISLFQQALNDVLDGSRWAALSQLWPTEVRTKMCFIWHHLDTWPNEQRTLEILKESKIIASIGNEPGGVLVEISKFANLPWDIQFSSAMLGHSTSLPEAFTEAAHQLSVHARKCIMVSSNIWDLRAAAEAGMRTIYVCRRTENAIKAGYESDVRIKAEGGEVDVVVDSLFDLVDIMIPPTAPVRY